MGVNKFIILSLICIVLVSFGVQAVGQADVLEDIKGLANLYINNRCDDVTNISYGSLNGCKENSGSSYSINYNIGLALLSMLSNLEGNNTLLNATKEGLTSSYYLQNDAGDWPQGAELQDDGDVVQSYFTAVALADAYDRIQGELNSTQNESLKEMFGDYVNWLMITPTTNIHHGGYTGVERLSDYYLRKMINITYDQINRTDNIHLVIRSNYQGSPVDSEINVYIGTDTTKNYTYYTKYSNIDTNQYLEIKLNKTHLIDNCLDDTNQYICNFTLIRNYNWDSSNSLSVLRGTLLDSNNNWSWTSTDGSSWTSSNNERFVYLSFYDNSSMNLISGRRATTNQYLTRGLSCYKIYNILASDLNYEVTSNVADRCYKTIIGNVLIDQNDGIYPEWNEMYRDFGGNSTFPVYGGYSNHYNWITSYGMYLLYNQTQNSSFLSAMNNTMNNLSFFIYSSDLRRAGGFGTRSQSNSTILDSLSSSWVMYPLVSFISFMDLFNSQANSMNTFIKQYSPFNPSISYSGVVRYAYDIYPIIYLYENFPTSTNTTNMNTDSSKYIFNLNNSGLISLSTNGYRAFLSYQNNSPSGAIGQLSQRRGNTLFSGHSDRFDYNTYGLGCMITGNVSNGGNSSCFDSKSNQILSSTFPYKIIFTGNLTNPNQSIISNVNYSTTYTFYDNYIEINQSCSSSCELQLWGVSTETIGTGTISQGQVLVLDNSTFYPVNFDLTYKDTTETATWGVVDKFNATGTSFHYLIGIQPDNTATEYFADSQGRRLALPLWFSSSTDTTKEITSNLTDSINVTIILSDISYNHLGCSDLNSVTLNGESVSYTCNSPLTFTGQINSGVNSISLVFTSGQSGMCSGFLGGVDNVSSKIPIVLALLAIVMVLGVVGLIVKIHNGGEIGSGDFSIQEIIPYITGLGSIIILTIIVLIVLSVVCSL